MGKGRVYRVLKGVRLKIKQKEIYRLCPVEFGRICRARICKRLRSPGIDSRARIFKRLRSQGIDPSRLGNVSLAPERFINSGSGLPPTLTLIMYYLLPHSVEFQMSPRARICKPYKEPRNRFPALRNRFLGIDSGAPEMFTNTGSGPFLPSSFCRRKSPPTYLILPAIYNTDAIKFETLFQTVNVKLINRNC
jgi:hypothetical protein